MLPLISIVDSYCMNIRSRGHSDILQTCVQFNVVNVKVVMKCGTVIKLRALRKDTDFCKAKVVVVLASAMAIQFACW